MSFIVDEEYYTSVIELYKNQIAKIEQELDQFKTICENIYVSNDFGTRLQEVMQEIYCNVYMLTSGKLTELMAEIEDITSQFIEDVICKDKF